ncbi:TonB-dependent receptor plug domain-containing protein [Labilibaculum filiforme]|nr:TonB-dependent receptor plug domain-containing protein [Labilibaculum filiforme]
MKNLIVYGLLILFSSLFSSAYSQKTSYLGQVLVFDSIPVINAEITVFSSKQIVKSDSEGYFSFEGESNEKVNVSANGFVANSQDLIGDSISNKVILQIKNSKKYRKLAVESGHIKDPKQLLAAIQYSKNNPDYSRYTNAVQIITDKYPGVSVEYNGVIIRGRRSLNGPNEALIEIDGMILDFSSLSDLATSTIKSIKILSPGESGMYGSRGANGVVVIKTKKGTRK